LTHRTSIAICCPGINSLNLILRSNGNFSEEIADIIDSDADNSNSHRQLYSNGKNWLDSPFQQPNASSIALIDVPLLPSSVHDKRSISLLIHPVLGVKKHTSRESIRKYSILIHPDSFYDIGQTYQVALDWNNTSTFWRRTATESIPTSLQGIGNNRASRFYTVK